MTAAMTANGPCEHLQPGTWPLVIDLLLDEQITFTDALTHCRHCGRRYLLEMLDWRGAERVLRIAQVDDGQARGVLHDLGRGSCDLRRAGAEVHHLLTSSAFAPWLLLIDSRSPLLRALVPAPAGRPLPAGSWRTLACDGSWVDYARSNTEMVKG